MALRLIELILPEENSKEVKELIKEYQELGIWHERLSENQVLVKILLKAEDTETVLDILEKRFSNVDGFRVILLPVEASIPRPKESEKAPPEETKPQQESALEVKPERISREELYADVVDAAKISKVYIIMVVSSSIVASIGILHNNVAVIIGAMVIAPLLGPNMALSLATTLGDMVLARNSLKANILGVLLTLTFSFFVGLIFTLDPDLPEIVSRTKVDISDVALALASGSTGALAFTTGVSAVLIGVMVAVALLPPVVTLGMMLGAGYWEKASGALLLFLTNLICVNLAGVITFLIQGVRPLTWWEKDRARKATRIAISLWISLLVALIGIILLSQKR